MIIITRQEFLKVPSGIAFAKYQLSDGISCDDYEGLCIKTKTYYDDDNNPIDFDSMQLADTQSSSRDGMFDDDQVFAIFYANDIDKIIELLQIAKTKVKP